MREKAHPVETTETRAKPSSLVLISDPILNCIPPQFPVQPNTSGQFSQANTAWHWVSLELQLKVAYVFWKVGAPGVHVVPAISKKKKKKKGGGEKSVYFPRENTKRRQKHFRRFPRGAALDEPHMAKRTSLWGAARTDEK